MERTITVDVLLFQVVSPRAWQKRRVRVLLFSIPQFPTGSPRTQEFLGRHVWIKLVQTQVCANTYLYRRVRRGGGRGREDYQMWRNDQPPLNRQEETQAWVWTRCTVPAAFRRKCIAKSFWLQNSTFSRVPVVFTKQFFCQNSDVHHSVRCAQVRMF